MDHTTGWIKVTGTDDHGRPLTTFINLRAIGAVVITQGKAVVHHGGATINLMGDSPAQLMQALDKFCEREVVS